MQVVAGAIEVQHARRCPVGEGLFGDQLVREVVVELRNQHQPIMLQRTSRKDSEVSSRNSKNWVTIEALGRLSPAFRFHEDYSRTEGRNRPLRENASPDRPGGRDGWEPVRTPGRRKISLH